MALNGIDLYTMQRMTTAAASQETIDPTAAVSAPAESTVSKSGFGRFASAGFATIIFAVFFFALLWGLGEMTGEALFRRVESAVS